MICQVFRNDSGEITSVTAPNGNQSKLFDSISGLVPNKEQALRLWAQVYTPSFKEWFGDWQSGKGSKIVDENGEPLLLFHGTGAKFAEFDKELRGSTTGKSADGSKSFDAENAFFFTNNENVAFNYAIMARQQELMLISTSLQTITSTLSWDQKRRQEVYDSLRKESPKFAAYVDGLKNQGLNNSQIMEKLKHLYEKYRELEKDYGRGGSISNPRRYYNDAANDINNLEKIKSSVVGGSYTSVSKYGPESDLRFSLGYDGFYILSDGRMVGDIKRVPELKEFSQRNIAKLNAKEFDDLINGLRRVVQYGKDKIEEDIKKGGFTPELMPVFLNVRTPQVKDFKGEPFVMQDDGRGALMDVSLLVKAGAEDKNTDGAILKNISDPELADNYAVYEPNQIKSVFNQGTFSKAANNIYQQQERQSEEAPDENIENKVKRFLSSIGVSIDMVKQLRDREGNPLSGVAMADMLNKVISVVEGQADITTLPEEAAHFFVQLLGVNNPLYKEMYSAITGYKIYSDVVEQYKNNKLYRNQDGSLNIDALKKEAIGKLIMSHIVSQETGSEDGVKVIKAQKWWAKVWEIIKSIFNKANKRNGVIENPFAVAATKILTNDTSGLDQANLGDAIYQQQTNDSIGASIFNKIKQDQQNITIDNSEDPITKKPRHVYSKNGEEILNADGSSRSITHNVVDPWYRQRFPIDRRSDIQKIIDEMKAEYGTAIHKEIDNIIDRYVDDATGLVRKSPTPFTNSGELNLDVYSTLDRYIAALLRSYPEKTRFIAEARIFNSKKRLPGTTDLIAILPDGSADVYDWKSQEVRDDETELKWFKEPAYRLQLDEYTETLQQEYGILKFNKVRAIPIRTKINYRKHAGDWVPSDLKSIEIGPLDASLIPESKEYLLPVVSKNESTGDEMLDKLIEKLNVVHEQLSQKSSKDKEKKNLELNKLKKTIRTLQVKQDMKHFVQSGLIEIEKYQEKLLDNSLTKGEVLQAIPIMEVYALGSVYIKSLLVKLKKQINDAEPGREKEDLEKQQDDYKTMALNAQDLIVSLKQRAQKIGDEEAKREGILGLLNPERVMDYLKRNFRSLSTLETAGAQMLNRVLNRARQQRDIEAEEKFEHLDTLRKSLLTWAQEKGIPTEKIFDGILDGHNFLDIYSKEYREERRKALKRGDVEWVKENTVFDKEAYTKAFKKYKEAVESDIYSTDPAIDKEKKERTILRWIELHNGEQSTTAMLMNKGNFRKPKEQWYSEKYKELYRKDAKGNLVNKPLADAYEYFQSLLRDSEKAGMIDYEFGFIPSMHKTKLESFVFNDYTGVFKKENFFQGLQVDSSNQFGKVDPLNGKPVLEIPVFFTRDLEENKSLDLFKVFGVWAAHTANYKAMTSIEDTANLLMFIENNKGSMQTNMFGKVKKGGKIDSNVTNAEVLENHIKYQIYGQKIDISEDKTIEIMGKELSLTRSLQKAMHWMSLKTLALNPISGTAALVGGSMNASFMAAKNLHFSDKDWGNGVVDFTSRDEMSLGFLDYIAPELEDVTYRKTRQLSISEAVKRFNAEDLFVIQRTSDKLVVLPVALAMYRSHMVDDNGKIVPIMDYVKAKHGYDNIYNLTSVERKRVMGEINKEVEELKKTRSLKAMSKLVDGKFQIEGLSRGSDEIMLFRNKIKKINKTLIGNATTEDITQFRMGMLGQIFLQFRTWIPQMVIERFGDAAYDSELETYTFGKARIFFKHFYSKNLMPLIGELITGYGSNAIDRAKERYREMVIRMKEQGDENFENRMTEAQFIDMYLANLRSMKRELLMLLAFLALTFWAKNAGDDDDDKKKSGAQKFIARSMDKYYNELAFFYNPKEARSLIKSPAPITGLLEDMYSFFSNVMGEGMGLAIQDQEALKENHPMKYFYKMFPVTKVGEDMFALIDDDFRKDMGLK